MADAVMRHLCIEPLPDSCPSMKAARSYVRRSVNSTILDPSMEAGQLLLAVGESWRRRVLSRFGKDNPEGRRLIQAGWEHLCSSVLFGVDLNPLAGIAVRTAFELTSRSHGLASMAPLNLATGDFLRTDIESDAAPVDVILNNPPWGEHVSCEYRKFLKDNFRSCYSHPDTYLAYVEKSLNQLNEKGLLVLALPTAVLTTRKAAEIRARICQSVALTEILVMPGQVFSDAASRSAVLVGRRGHRYRRKLCSMVDFSCDASRPTIIGEKTTQNHLRDSAKDGWLQHFGTCSLPFRKRSTVQLGDVAKVTSGRPLAPDHVVVSGVKHSFRECRQVFRSTLPFGYIPVIDPKCVLPWCVQEVETHLASQVRLSPDIHSDIQAGRDRIVVRSIIRPDGGLWASSMDFAALPRRGVITVAPTDIDLHLLLAILNSETVRDWVRTTQSYIDRWRMQKITISELKRLPIPYHIIGEIQPSNSKRPLSSRSNRLSAKVSRLSRKITTQGSVTPPDYRQINHWVEQLYETR